MPTIFTKAKAAKKVIRLLNGQCGIRRSKLRCDSRLETDLGIVGDDTWEVLQAMRDELGVDMNGFDCEDYVSPEVSPPALGVPVALFLTGGVFCLYGVLPTLYGIISLLVGLIGFLLSGRSSKSAHLELRVRDLLNAVEAGRWVSPKP